MGNKNMLNVEKLQGMARMFAEEYSEKGLLGFMTHEGLNQIQVKKEFFFETFGDKEYTVTPRGCDTYPFQYNYYTGDSVFICITEKAH